MKDVQINQLMSGVFELTPRQQGNGQDLAQVIRVLEDKIKQMELIQSA
ncbi:MULTISPECIES: hypothetical protein [Bacillus]|nr:MULTISPECIES: hypothetical protein [Bacillus]MBU8740379.1 hypothetical protein [Bacillus licheniformis]MCY8009726.1 hypothetical protein [Bacillus haynesii]MCY8567426.1 hypothetical protein [Bacillus haynesii]